MAKQDKKQEQEQQESVEWNASQLKIGDVIQVSLEVTEITSDGTRKSIVAKPVDLPQGINAGNVVLGAAPQAPAQTETTSEKE